ncbi:MAG: tetratricopeptide repeat protein [bacterium]|nr:tetratricopeptide repeat protein [Candidatus Sumerlaeota bacterium]
MTRFANIEFDNEDRGKPEESQQREIRDEFFLLKQADSAFEVADFEKALRLYSRALDSNPNLEAGWVGQVRMLIELGEFKEAGLWVDKALDIFKNHPDLLAAKSVICCRMGDRRKALEFSDVASMQKSSSPYVWIARGEVLLATGDRNADFCIEKAKSVAPRDWFSLLNTARVYYICRKYCKALEIAREALDLKTTSPFVWFVMGLCQRELGMRSQSIKSFQQALSLDRNFKPAESALQSSNRMNAFKQLFAPLRRLLKM